MFGGQAGDEGVLEEEEEEELEDVEGAKGVRRDIPAGQHTR